GLAAAIESSTGPVSCSRVGTTSVFQCVAARMAPGERSTVTFSAKADQGVGTASILSSTSQRGCEQGGANNSATANVSIVEPAPASPPTTGPPTTAPPPPSPPTPVPTPAPTPPASGGGGGAVDGALLAAL